MNRPYAPSRLRSNVGASTTRGCIHRILSIQIPFQRIVDVDDVLASTGQFIFIADNPCIIIALPDAEFFSSSGRVSFYRTLRLVNERTRRP